MIYPHFLTTGLYSEDLRVLKKAAKYLFPFCMWEDFSCRDNRFVQSKWKGWEQTFHSPSSGMSTSPGGLYGDPNLHSFSHVPGPRCLLPTHCMWLQLEALLHARLGTFAASQMAMLRREVQDLGCDVSNALQLGSVNSRDLWFKVYYANFIYNTKLSGFIRLVQR